MGRTYQEIDDRLAKFILAQPVFFVATAPSGSDGHINCSPKGNQDSLAILGEREVAYRDLTGSGIETVAHLQDNGRVVLMFCAFEGPPRIVRLHGHGEVLTVKDPRFDELMTRFTPHESTRVIIRIDVMRISDSCGYGVPIMNFERHRDNIDRWVESKGGRSGVERYQAERNAESLDGLPGLSGLSGLSARRGMSA